MTPHWSARSVGLGGAQARAHRLGRRDHLGEALAHVRQAQRIGHLGDARGEAEHEFRLGDVFHYHLMHHVDDRVGLAIERVASGDVAAQKHPLPGYQHMIEDDDAVHLLEARGERRIEVRAPHRCR